MLEPVYTHTHTALGAELAEQTSKPDCLLSLAVHIQLPLLLSSCCVSVSELFIYEINLGFHSTQRPVNSGKCYSFNYTLLK